MSSQNGNSLLWRYATKKFDPSKKVPESQFTELIEALRLAPSSFGLQPWKFAVVVNPALRKELQAHAWNQPQVADASHLIVLCALKSIDEAYVKQFIKQLASQRGVSVESLKSYEEMMLGFVKGHTKEWLSEWMKKQVYLALGFLIYAASDRHIDSCPMEGFDSKKFDEILKLGDEGIESVVLCPVGYRSSEDPYSSLKKVRFSSQEVVVAKN